MTRLTVGKQLSLLVGLFLLNIALVNAFSYWIARELGDRINVLGGLELPAVRSMGMVDMMHDGLRGTVYSAVLYGAGRPVASPDEIRAELDEMAGIMKEHLDTLQGLDLDAEAAAAIAAARPRVEAYLAAGSALVDLGLKKDLVAVQGQIGQFGQAFEELEESLGLLGELIEKHAKNSVEDGHNIGTKASQWNVILFAISLTAGALISGAVITSLLRRLKALISDLFAATTNVRGVVSVVDGSAQQLSSSATQQASAIEESVASMEEMTAMIGQTASNSEEGRRIARDCVAEGERGREVVDRMSVMMDEINSTATDLQKIVGLISEIEAKTKVINDIVFETRLLSFNASIEAARAGVHGKGFAVVAEEVGKLAAMSGKSADEIRVLLENSTREVSQAVASTQERVKRGKEVSTQCASSFASIVSTVERIAQAMDGISTANKEQEGGVRQTSAAMAEMEKLTQRNSENANVLASQASNLIEGTQVLDRAVGIMRQLVAGDGDDSGSSNHTSARDAAAPVVQPRATTQKLGQKLRTVAERSISRFNKAA